MMPTTPQPSRGKSYPFPGSALLLFPGSTWEQFTRGSASCFGRQQPTKGIPWQSQGTRKYVILLFALVIGIISNSVASAHNVKTTADVGGTIHIQPNDNPRAGERSQVWVALTRKGGKVIPLKECNCQLAVYAEPHSPGEPALLEPSLQAISAERYKGIPGSEITFPKPGAYLLQLSGKPASGASFQPFKLKFEVTVAAGSASATETQNVQNVNDAVEDRKSGFSLPIAIALSALALAGIVFIVQQRRR
jgi:hypothetical protein